MVGVASPTAGHPHLVDGAQGHSGDKRPPEACLENQSILLCPKVRMRVLLEPEYTVPPALKSLNRNGFLPDELSY